MAEEENKARSIPTRMELMKVVDDVRLTGTNFHVYVRNRMPSTREFPEIENDRWETVREMIETTFDWRPGHRFEWNELTHVAKPHNHYGIYLTGGVTCYRSDSIQKIQVISDPDSDKQIVNEIINLVNDVEHTLVSNPGPTAWPLILRSYEGS